MSETSFIRPDELWRSLGLRAGQVAVHLGCGAGFYLIPAAKIVGASGKAIGVDVLTHLLAEVENRARREQLQNVVTTIRANLEVDGGSTLPADHADFVLVANILHQSQPAKILQEAARIVKQGGSVVVVEWDTAATPLGPPSNERVSRTQTTAVAREQGLHVERLFTPSPYHYGLVLKKTQIK